MMLPCFWSLEGGRARLLLLMTASAAFCAKGSRGAGERMGLCSGGLYGGTSLLGEGLAGWVGRDLGDATPGGSHFPRLISSLTLVWQSPVLTKRHWVPGHSVLKMGLFRRDIHGAPFY